MIRLATLGAILALSLYVSPSALAGPKDRPHWVLLNTPKAPPDALRWSGNAEPVDGTAKGVWRDAQRRKKKLLGAQRDWACRFW